MAHPTERELRCFSSCRPATRWCAVANSLFDENGGFSTCCAARYQIVSKQKTLFATAPSKLNFQHRAINAGFSSVSLREHFQYRQSELLLHRSGKNNLLLTNTAKVWCSDFL